MNRSLRFLTAAAWALFPALGLSSPALAGDVQIEVRPVLAGDGGLSRHGRRNMIRAEEKGWLKQWLTEKLDYVGSNPRFSYPLFDLAALRQGRAMTVETTLTTGEILAADFDLRGLAEALDLMEVEMAKSLRVTEREIAELKKRLAGLD